MSLHDHSSTRITIEMPDFFFCAGRFQPSHLLLSATECSDLKSVAMVAARPATAECLLKPGWGGIPLSWARCASSRVQATCRGGFSELLRGAALSGHSSESAAGTCRWLPSTRHNHCTVCIRRLLGLNVAYSPHLSLGCYSMLYSIDISHLSMIL